MIAKKLGPLGGIVDVTDILLEVGRYFSVPNSGRYGDRDRTTDRTP
jgi:hypothetical protein